MFSEIMHNTWKQKIIKYGTKVLNSSKMVNILNYLKLIWRVPGLIGLITMTWILGVMVEVFSDFSRLLCSINHLL